MASLATIATIASIGGTIVSAIGTIAAGNAQRRAANFQAAQLEQQAGQELAASQREAYEYQRNKDLALSRQQAVAGASGLSATDPSVLFLAGETAGRGRYQEEMALYTGKARQQGFQNQAKATRLSGQAAAQGAMFDAAGTILGGFGSFFDKYGRLNAGTNSNAMPRYIYG